MQIVPGDAPDEALLQPSAFDRCVSIRGLHPEALEDLLRGRQAGRRAWQRGLKLSARLLDEPTDPAGKLQDFELDDGCAVLRSGAAGKVQVQSHHELGDVLQPISLNLLLAQQWARAGLLLVHGAAFEIQGTGILAMGEREAGKSVLTAAVLAAGGQIVSDDWVMLGRSDDGAFRAERLRDFLMFRKGWASHTLLGRLPDLVWADNPDDPKHIVRIKGQPKETFPEAIRIDRIWLLERDGPDRPLETTENSGTPIDAMKALMRATTPVLLSNRLPRERKALLELTRSLTGVLPSGRIRTGLDLVSTPATVLGKINRPAS